MSRSFSVSEAQLTGMFVQAVCFGVLLVTFGFGQHALFASKRRLRRPSEVNWLMATFSILSFILAVFDMSLALYHNLEVFIFIKDKGGPDQLFGNVSSWITVTKVRICFT